MSIRVAKAMLIDDSEIDLFIHRRFLELCSFSKELLTYRSAESALDWFTKPIKQTDLEALKILVAE